MRPHSAQTWKPLVAAGNGNGNEVAATVWNAPEPLVAQHEVSPYPVDALPEGIRQAVEEVQGIVQAPVELVSASGLTALSIAGQQIADVRRDNGLCGPVSLFFLTVAESGERKSSVDAIFAKPIREQERAAREAATGELANHSAAMTAWEASREASAGKLKKAAVEGKDLSAHTVDLANVENGKPSSPRVPRWLYSDVTIEKLTRNLATNWPAAAIVSSEGGAILGGHSLGKDSAMRTMSAYNDLWSGTPFNIDRATSDSYCVRNVRFTIGLQVQPSVLESFMGRERNFRGGGSVARFLFSAPASTQGRRQFRPAPSVWRALEPFNVRIAELLAITPNIDADGGLCLPLLDFTPEAKAAWVGCYNLIEAQLGPTGELANVRDLASKAADNIARLAALFHIFEHGASGAIGIEHLDSAGRIVAWHLEQGRNYLGAFNVSPATAAAAALDRWLIETCEREGAAEIPRRKVQQYGPAAVRDKAALAAAIEELAENHRAREVRDGRQKLIRLNPALLMGAQDAA